MDIKYYNTLATKLKRIHEKATDISDYVGEENEQEKALEIVYLLEKCLTDLRSDLIFYTKDKERLFAEVPVTVKHEEDGSILINLPRLLPRLKKTGAEPYFTQILYYMIETNIPKEILYKPKDKAKKVLIYKHYYTDENSVCDYDNNDTKTIQDILTTFFLYDDSPAYLEVHHLSEQSDSTYTSIILTDKKNSKNYLF